MGTCKLCGKTSMLVSDAIGVCYECLVSRPEEALEVVRARREAWRAKYNLPPRPPRGGKIKCRFCVNECELDEGGLGFCGIMTCSDGRLTPITGSWDLGIVHWYLDPHPTNCVAVKVCPAATCRGYPKYTRFEGVEEGYYNLAVFYAGCSLDCAFCQNWEHREMAYKASPARSVEELVEAAMNPKVTCVCYFGGDPGPHAVHALWASRIIVERRGDVRICWETNGVENPNVMEQMMRLSLDTGGIVKVDFKAWTPSVYEALTGVNGVERVKENIEKIAKHFDERSDPPLLTVSVLLVPGYVTVEEVKSIAEYLASLNENIPLILLAFHPDYVMNDLPRTSTSHALRALREAREAGLREVYLENVWLLGNYY